MKFDVNVVFTEIICYRIPLPIFDIIVSYQSKYRINWDLKLIQNTTLDFNVTIICVFTLVKR